MDLTKLTGYPELVVEVDGEAYGFSELPIDKIARLQSYLNQITPHPLDSLKGRLDGLTSEDRQFLLERARKDSLAWPPRIGTAEGAAALLGHAEGQLEAFFVGVSIHQSSTTRDEAAKLLKRLGRQAGGEGLATRIFKVLFGLDPNDDPETPPNRGGPRPTPASTGGSSSGARSKS